MMRQKGGHGLQARITIDDIPQAQLDLLNSSTVTYEIRDTKTGVLESTVTRPMRSFTANFLRLMWGRMTGTACTGGLDINDTAIDESSGKATNLKCVGATTGLKKFGICIGTGTGAVAQNDNKLTWDTGFSTYGATTLKTATTISGSDIYFEIQKAFTNNTGSTRTVQEAGLCTTGEGTEADNNTNVLIARELTGGTAVATGKVLTVVFKISSTFTTDGTIAKGFIESLESAFYANAGSPYRQKTASASWSAEHGFSMVNFNGALYTMFSGTSVWKSVDGGENWTQVRAAADANGYLARSFAASLVFVDPADGINKIWIMGGYDSGSCRNSVYKSADGATWTQATASAAWEARRTPCVWVYNSKMWIGAGRDAGSTGIASVYYSTDGVNWTQATASAAFGTIYGAASCVCNGKMWICGGYNSSTGMKNFVYYSTNGATWTQATASAAWAVRYYHSMAAVNGTMFVFGGLDSTATSNYADVYSSTDGVTWSLVSSDGGYLSREQFGYCVIGRGIIVAGGYRRATSGAVNSVYGCCISQFSLATSATMPDSARIDPTSDDVYGITVGTGTGNFTGLDTLLGTPIADGSSAGQLAYGNMQDAGRLTEPTVSGSDNIMRLERDFTNSSGGSITIKEVGLSAKGLDALGLLLMRGKVDKTVADGASVRVSIELVTTV